MVDKNDPDLMHFARRIDTKISPPLGKMVNEGMLAMLQQLAVRNLLRGYLLSLPTGTTCSQHVLHAAGWLLLSAMQHCFISPAG